MHKNTAFVRGINLNPRSQLYRCRSQMKCPVFFSSNFRCGFFVRSLIQQSLHLTAPFTSDTDAGWTTRSISGKDNTLYRRISPIGNPQVSVVPVLDQWVRDGKEVEPEQLRIIIKELATYRRYKHALEISQWMNEKRYIPPRAADIAVRLNLIYRVHGIQQMEDYVNRTQRHLKVFGVYTALLNCYCQEKLTEKAEATMQMIRDAGFLKNPWPYNILMKHYCQINDLEKLRSLMHEMEELELPFDQFRYTTYLNAYIVLSDPTGINRIIEKMRKGLAVDVTWNAYAMAASGYSKLGHEDKMMSMLNEIEKLIPRVKKPCFAFTFLLKFYAELEKKEDLLRIWNLYKRSKKLYNNGYISMMKSLLKLDDIENAEEVLKEWESSNLTYDFRIPNLLISAYCRRGLLHKSEALLEREVNKGGEPLANTWYFLSEAYFENSEIAKAVEALRKLMLLTEPESDKETFATCLEYLKEKVDVKVAEALVGVLRDKDIFSEAARNNLLTYMTNGTGLSSLEDAINQGP